MVDYRRKKRKRPVSAWVAIGALCALAELVVELVKMLAGT
jgi:hypothetical protein